MIEIILPAMGEGIIEAEITRWLVTEGETVEADQPVVEVATDKVDSEIPSPGSGSIQKILLNEGDTVKVGQVLALIASEAATDDTVDIPDKEMESVGAAEPETTEVPEKPDEAETGVKTEPIVETRPIIEQEIIDTKRTFENAAFISPLIRKLAVENNVSPAELQGLSGSGLHGRITKPDLMAYIHTRKAPENQKTAKSHKNQKDIKTTEGKKTIPEKEPDLKVSENRPVSQEQIYGGGPSSVSEMDRMRKLIAEHMVYSKKVAPHVSSTVEADLTEMVLWRARHKDVFEKKYGQRLTLTALIFEAVIKSLKAFPKLNASVDGDKIIIKHHLNIGMATALPDGNLIVPVIHEADRYNLPGLAARINELAGNARKGALQPSDIQGGTFTVTNMGQFGNVSGVPIINQPQVAILAIGSILKKPAVIRAGGIDTIGIRQVVNLTLSYDHRVVDGALGGRFLKNIADKLQDFESGRDV